MKSPFEIITDQTIQALELNKDNVYYTGIHEDKNILGNLYIANDSNELDSYIENVNVYDDLDFNLYRNKKCFIMPGNSITGQRVSEFLKEFDITVTNDSTKADIYIYNKRCDDIYDPELNKNCCFYNVNSQFYYYHHDENKYLNYNLDQYIRENEIDTINKYSTYRYVKFIGGTALNILASGKIIVNEDCIKNQIKSFVLDEETVDSFTSLLNSRRDEDMAIVAKVIPTINILKNQDQVFRFIFENSNRLNYSFNRDKDVQSWLNDIKAHKFYNSNSSYLIRYFDSIGMLTKEGFRYLEKKARSRIEINNRDIYSFTVKIKDEYKKYLVK